MVAVVVLPLSPHFLVHFSAVLCITTTWNFLMPRFTEVTYIRRRVFPFLHATFYGGCKYPAKIFLLLYFVWTENFPNLTNLASCNFRDIVFKECKIILCLCCRCHSFAEKLLNVHARYTSVHLQESSKKNLASFFLVISVDANPSLTFWKHYYLKRGLKRFFFTTLTLPV